MIEWNWKPKLRKPTQSAIDDDDDDNNNDDYKCILMYVYYIWPRF